METFREKLNEIKRIIDDDIYRRRVMLLCEQSEPRSFDDYSSSGSFRRLEKFESSTYSEVLKAIDMADNNKPVVMKIMRALSRGVIKRMPSITTKGCQSYNDILNELVVTQALSQLHDGVILNGQPHSLYRTHFFCQIHEIKVVSGNLARTLNKSKKQRATPAVKGSAAEEAATTTTDTTAITSENKLTSEPPADTKRGVAVAATNNDTEKQPKSAQSTIATRPDLETSKTSKTGFSTSPSSSSSSASSPAENLGEGKIKRLDKMSKNLSVAMVENVPGEVAAATEVEAAPLDKRADDDVQQPKVLNQQQQVNDKNCEAPPSEQDDLNRLPEDERMLMEALPNEYVVSVMRHDGQPLWWMMTHKKLTPEQLISVLTQVIVGLAIAETVYLYEHRDLHVSNILIKRTTNDSIPFIMDGSRYCVLSQGIKATIIDATFSRLTHNGRVYFRDLTSTLRAYGSKKTPTKMSLQNRSYRQMVRLTKNKWDEFTPKTNLIWLTYLCETLMKNEIMKSNKLLLAEVRKIRDHTLKVKTTFDLLACFPFERVSKLQTSQQANSNGHKSSQVPAVDEKKV